MNVSERFSGIAPLRFFLPIISPLQIAFVPGSTGAFTNEHAPMGKNSHRRDIRNLQDSADIYFSNSTSPYVNKNLQFFFPSFEITPNELREISSSNLFYLILFINVTSVFFQRLIECGLCAQN
jgi:hypothetical protein